MRREISLGAMRLRGEGTSPAPVGYLGARASRGFTLIELLVVIGIIVAFTGVLALGLRGPGTQSVALRSAQVQVASLLGATRAHAVQQQVSARLLIYADPPPLGDAGKYLRYLQMAAENPVERGQWIALGSPVVLPQPVFVVPPMMPASHLLAGVQWPSGPFAPLSVLIGPTRFILDEQDFGLAYCIEYAPDGRLTAHTPKLALALAQPSSQALPRFDHPAAVRGIALRSSGALELIDAGHGF